MAGLGFFGARQGAVDISALRLSLPEPDPVINPKTEVEAAELRKWAEALPYADPLRVIESCLSELVLINRHPEPLRQHQQLIEVFLRPFEHLMGDMRRLSRGSANGLSRRENRQLELFRDLINELAYAHKRLLLDTLSRSNMKPAVAARFAYFSVKFLGLYLTFSYAAFQPVPTMVWRELLQIYLLGREYRLAEVGIEDDPGCRTGPKTLELRLRQQLLIQLLDPYRLSPGEIWAAERYLCRWGELARFEQSRELDDKPGLFLVDLRGIESPMFLARRKGQPLAEYHQIFNVEPLIRQAHQHLHQLDAQDKSSIPPGTEGLDLREITAMLRNMLIAWHMQPERRHTRIEKYGRLELAAGINAAHHFQSQGEMGGEPEEGDEETVQISASPFARAHRVQYKSFVCRQVNVSETGIGLESNGDAPDNLQVGQLLLLQEDSNDPWDDTPRRFVGVVRRLLRHPGGRVEFGIQRLAGEARPVRVASMGEDFSGQPNFQPALLIERDDPANNLLLSPRGVYQEEGAVMLERDGRALRVQCAKLLERNHYFDRFQFRDS